MPYTFFDPAKPDAATQNGTLFGTGIRNNHNALRDAAIMGGGFFGFAMAATGGTPAQPAVITYSKDTERVKAALTWGTVGGEAGNVTAATYSYSANSGTLYDVIGTKTVAYDASANVVSTTWS